VYHTETREAERERVRIGAESTLTYAPIASQKYRDRERVHRTAGLVLQPLFEDTL
jgi:hypothetical protein